MGMLPSNGDGRRYWPPRPAQKPREDFLVSPGVMPRDGNGGAYRPPRAAQKPRGDFVVAKGMLGDGDGHRC